MMRLLKAWLDLWCGLSVEWERRKPYFPAVFPPITAIHNILVLMGSTRHNGAEQTDRPNGIKGVGNDGEPPPHDRHECMSEWWSTDIS